MLNGGKVLGIIQTNQWLQEDFDRPTKICEKLRPYFNGQTSIEIYNQLKNFGMYRPSRSSRNNLNRMLHDNLWDKVEQLFLKYKSKWNGPDIPIFLFPVAQGGGFFRAEEKNKAGVSFPDKMFLFLSYYEDIKEIEALLVHEYHHACRMHLLDKKMEDFTLLDSLIIEGLAEYAVLKNCGKEYLANWCNMYSEKEIALFWKKFLKNQLDMRKNERSHDALLYGGRGIPKLLGYAVGYNIIDKYYCNHNYSTKLSFTIPADKYIDINKIFSEKAN